MIDSVDFFNDVEEELTTKEEIEFKINGKSYTIMKSRAKPDIKKIQVWAEQRKDRIKRIILTQSHHRNTLNLEAVKVEYDYDLSEELCALMYDFIKERSIDDFGMLTVDKTDVVDPENVIFENKQ